MKSLRYLTAGLLALASLPALALTDASRTQLERIQGRWAEINYQTPADKRESAFADLAQLADRAIAAEPQAAELRIWKGIVLSTWAGAKGGLGALGIAKDSRARLEAALKIDETALSGSAHTSIGTLYHKVPGFPVGFGSDKKAEEHLLKALQMNPDGIDPNYFYGEFLYDDGEYQDALKHLNKALAAPPRPGRELADEGRRGEIRALIAKTQDELS